LEVSVDGTSWDCFCHPKRHSGIEENPIWYLLAILNMSEAFA